MDDHDHRVTGCTCTTPGFCERHQCHKTAHWVHLCQTRPDYFKLWEEGKGPGQAVTREPLKPKPKKKKYWCQGCERKHTAWWAQTWDFVRAMASFVVDGAKVVSKPQYKERLEACTKCDQLDTKTSRCKACGCFVKIKARGAVWDCPQGKWPEIR